VRGASSGSSILGPHFGRLFVLIVRHRCAYLPPHVQFTEERYMKTRTTWLVGAIAITMTLFAGTAFAGKTCEEQEAKDGACQ
jgi:hypothetical protein